MRALPLDIGTLHFIGIGGIGMSGIAEILHNLGYKVQGSDVADGANVRRLQELGMKISIGHRAENLGDARVIVISSAVKADNPEVQAARERFDVTIEEVAKKVVKPLKGLKVVPYYGCLLTRPYSSFDDQHNPTSMDKILKAAGADVIDWPMKTMCCGGSETGTLPEVGLHLVYILLKEAIRRGADVIATICPLCQFNLEAYQDKIASRYEKISMPVVYFSQILGLSMGLSPKEVGLQRALVPATPVLERMEVKNV